MVVPATCFPAVGAGMAALQLFYNLSTGLWNTGDWWHAANAMETTIDYSRITNTNTYRSNIFHTFEKHKHTKFLNRWFNDDDGWWALTWIKAYDLTGETRYLDMAKTIFQAMSQEWDSVCEGGIWWKKTEHAYKNAITNELFLTVAVRLHLRTPGDRGPGSYLDWSQKTWRWFQKSGMINRENLVNDGLDSACRNNGQTTWTYNQGVILGGLVDLHRATGDRALLEQANAIAQAAIRKLAPNGILREPCEANNDCGNDGPLFKGIFIRNLHYLYETTRNPAYRAFILQNAETIWAQSRNSINQFGLTWAGPFDRSDVMRQSSAMDAINAAIALGTTNLSYPAAQSQRNGSKVVPTLPGQTGQTGQTTVVGRTPSQDKSVPEQAASEQAITFNVEVACAGHYDLSFRYSAVGNTAGDLAINGRRIVAAQAFPSTLTWQTWSEAIVSRVWLNMGHNTVSLIFHGDRASRSPLNLETLTVRSAG